MTNYTSIGLAMVVALTAFLLAPHPVAKLQEATAVMDPRLASQFEVNDKVKVLVSLAQPQLPMKDWTVGLRRQNASQRQERVLESLRSEDFVLISQFDRAAALSGYVSRSGADKLAVHPDVIAVGVVGLGSYGLAESVPLVEADVVHSAGWDGSGVNVAVLDTGIDAGHLDLSDSIVGEVCFPEETPCGPPANPAEDLVGHGTQVSGVITSNGTSPGVPKGVAPGAGVFLYATGPVAPDEGSVLKALEDIESRGYIVDFVNMSFGLGSVLFGGACSSVFPAIETQIAVNAFFGDVLSFAISHNQGNKSAMTFPACAPNVVAVGAVYDSTGTYPGPPCAETMVADKVACWSNSSSALDVLAPGCDMTTTDLGGGPTDPPVCGTSYASPAAAGVPALLKDAQIGLTAPQIELRMKATGKWVQDPLNNRWTQRVDARVALLTNDNGDWDGDGCTNGAEYGTDSTLGGLRNPLDPWDYYDVSIPKDGVIDLFNDIVGVINHYQPDGLPPYNAYYDRGPSGGPNPWNMTASDGVIDLFNDISGVIRQFGHNCT